MAKFQLKAGAEVDVLTEDELQRQVDRLERALTSKKQDRPTMRRATTELVADGSGNISGGIGVGGNANVLYQCPVGFVAYVHRLNINAPGTVPGTPITTGSLVICRNANLAANVEYNFPGDGSPSANVAPALVTDGQFSALWVNGGDMLVAGGAGLTAGLTLLVTMQIRLWQGDSSGSASS